MHLSNNRSIRLILALVLTIALALLAAAGCSAASTSAAPAETVPAETPSAVTTTPETEPEPTTPEAVDIRIGGLKGPTSIGLVQLMESAALGEAANRYAFTVAGSADELTPKLAKGELDIAAVPANLAAVLYNNTKGQVKLLAINTLGVNYIVETGDTISSLEDLRGKTIYGSGKGSSPEYALRYLLNENGIDPDKDVTLEWKSEAAEVVATLSQLDEGIALMPQPYVAIAQSNLPDLKVALDLNQAWEDLDNGSLMITGVLVIRSEFLEQYPDQVMAFLDEYQASTAFANENVAEAAKLVEKYGLFKAAIAEKAIPFCNITYLEGAEMQTAMEGYLNVLFQQNPKSVGGTLPDDAFYVIR